MIINCIWILVGFLLLVKGGDFLVDGSVALARRARLSAMVIGLTVMGFGTSAPELLVSAQAAWAGSSGIALGNVAGSNIANIGLILGVTSLFCPLPAGRRVLRVDMSVMVVAMGALVLVAWNGRIERWMGVLMFVALVAFVWWEVWDCRRREKRQPPTADADVPAPMPAWRAVALVLLALAAMVWGADRLVEGATGVARQLGEMLGADPADLERIIGLTVVAVGTSLPELFASVIAARRGQTDMAVGNIIGSVTFNILCVVGVASAIRPIGGAWLPFRTDYAVMCLLGVLLWLFLRTGYKLSRREGAVLLAIYALYIVWLGVA